MFDWYECMVILLRFLPGFADLLETKDTNKMGSIARVNLGRLLTVCNRIADLCKARGITPVPLNCIKAIDDYEV